MLPRARPITAWGGLRGQPISDPQLIALGKSFGELEPPGMSPIGKPFIDEFPDILVISNIMEQGMPMGNLGAGEAIWHTVIFFIFNCSFS